VQPQDARHLALLKPAEVAERLAVSRTWLYQAAKSGRIPSIRIGGDDGPLRFIAEDIAQWLQDARDAPLSTQSAALTGSSPRRPRPLNHAP